MKKKKARIKNVQGGTVVELYSEQHKRWYKYGNIMPKSDARNLCMSEGYEIVSMR